MDLFGIHINEVLLDSIITLIILIVAVVYLVKKFSKKKK